MTKDLIRTFTDACYMAKKITEIEMNVPDGITRHQMHMMAAIHSLCEEHGNVCALELAAQLNIARRTALVYLHELETEGFVEKVHEPHTHGRIYVKLTERGDVFYASCIESYYEKIVSLFSNITNNDMMITVRTIRNMFLILTKYEASRTVSSFPDPDSGGSPAGCA